MERTGLAGAPGSGPEGPRDENATDGARELRVLAGRVRPVAPAADLVLPVPGELGPLLPGGSLRRGTVMSVEGAAGTGVTSVALELVAAATASGGWAAWVSVPGSGARSPAGHLGAMAAAEAGVELERLVVIRGVTRGRWSATVAAVLEGVSVVVAEPPAVGGVRRADARRLLARVRERRSVLLVLGGWPEQVAARLRVRGGPWQVEGGRLLGRALDLRVEHRGRESRRRVRIAAG